MLRIEKVFLQGFKSFCDPTEVVFDLEGITAVVGPNGCGKSNVADALSWVIGEQRAKALRGGKMEDVIFQGSRNRQASGMAEVVLTMKVSESFELRTADNIKEDFKSGEQIEPQVADSPAAATPESTVPEAKYQKKVFPKSTNRTFAEGEKISIARRLYRTGESEYEMNGRTCRLRDIQDLFAGTGLGAAHYAIIEQGRIGQVLSAKPLDRRTLIEEAAGVSKFKQRQRAAELKLEAAKQNLSRLTDIINEVDRQLNSLKRQAAKARRYQRLREEMRGLMRSVYVADYRVTLQQINELDKARTKITEQEAALINLLANQEAQRTASVSQATQVENNLTQARESVAATNLLLEKARQQEQFLQQQLNSLVRRVEESARDQVAISERSHFTAQETERLKSELKLVEQEIDREANSLSQAEKNNQVLVASERSTEAELENIQTKVTEGATMRERWRQLVKQFTETVNRCQRQLDGLSVEGSRAVEQEGAFSTALKKLAEGIYQVENNYLISATSLTQAEVLLQAKVEKQLQLNALTSKARLDFTTIEQRYKSLLELDEQRAYFSSAVQAISKELKSAGSAASFKILGTLADFVEVPSAQEKMVEIGLKEEMQYLIAPTFDDALKAIEFLRAGKHGRATFLVLDNKRQANPNPNYLAEIVEVNQLSVIRLLDVLNLKPELTAVLKRALPRLSETFIAPEITQAIHSSIQSNGKGHSFLTANGEFVSAGHLISGGSFAQQGMGVLAIKREISELEEQQLILSDEIQKLENLQAESGEQISQTTITRNSLDQQTRQLEKDLAVQRGQKQQAERELERAQSHLRVVEKESLHVSSELTEASNKLSHAEDELREAEQALSAAEQVTQAAQAKVAAARQASLERAQELSRRRADFAANSERRKGLLSAIRRLENEATDIYERLSRSQIEALEAEEKTISLQENLATSAAEALTLHEQIKAQIAQVDQTSQQLIAARERLTALENKLNTLRETQANLREQRTEIDISRTRRLSNTEHLAANCYEELGETIDELSIKFAQSEANFIVPDAPPEEIEENENDETLAPAPISIYHLPPDFELEAGKIRLTELKNKIENLGPVNLLALEELGEHEERLLFLLQQKADIDEAVADTQAAITEIKHRSRARFVAAFHEINKNFGEMFLELFGGGHGEMRLIDETDVLESGIDIIAQPPGKRLQSVLLLSGGEKAMAALALVMGIFKYRPSPFCLLDEVDAPLDDVNIGRFADKILEMSQQTQFMVITHSKRTMEAAKTLYGVTMQDPGVSKLISVRLT